MAWRVGGKQLQLLYGGLLVIIACAWSAWHWLHLAGLFYGDNLRWMAEARRAAEGEIIYRDFASMYPPLGILLTAFLYKTFGATFAVTNAMIDVLSLLLVITTWRVARRLLDETVALGCAIVLMCMGATNAGNFGLFSLSLYTPAILCGGIGLGLFLMGALDVVTDASRRWAYVLIVLGLTLALLSKLEHALAGITGFGVLAITTMPMPFGGKKARSWGFTFLALSVAVVMSSLLVYGLLARSAGWSNLLTGVAGYGIATQYCPFWPTGLGVFGAVSSLAQGAAVLATIAIVCALASRIDAPLRFLACVAVGGTALWAVHLPYALENFGSAQQSLRGVSLVAGYVLSFSGLLLPFMWASIALAVLLGVQLVRRVLRRSPSPVKDASVLLLLVVTVSLASRGTFGHMFGSVTTVHQSAYAFLLLLTPYLLLQAQALVDAVLRGSQSWRTLRNVTSPELRARPSRRAWVLLVVTAVFFTVPRVAKSLSRPVAPLLETAAGRIYVPDQASRDLYAYAIAHTKADDRILEVPLGGGVAFAARRQFSTYSMEFTGLLTPERMMHLDAALVHAHPPGLVLGRDSATLGASYGVCCRCACTFPHLVWRSHRLACDPGRRFEALDFVIAHYKVVARFGGFVAMAPAPAQGPQSLPHDLSNCGNCAGP